MTNIEQKALELVNEVILEVSSNTLARLDPYNPAHEAVRRAIERHEAFRQEVSDKVYLYLLHKSRWDEENLRSLIIKPDPLAEALAECDGVTNFGPGYNDDARVLRAALAKRGGRIVFDD